MLFLRCLEEVNKKTRIILQNNDLPLANKNRVPKDHWTLKTGYFEDPTPAIQVQTLPLEGPRPLGFQLFFQHTSFTHTSTKPLGKVPAYEKSSFM